MLVWFRPFPLFTVVYLDSLYFMLYLPFLLCLLMMPTKILYLVLKLQYVSFFVMQVLVQLQMVVICHFFMLWDIRDEGDQLELWTCNDSCGHIFVFCMLSPMFSLLVPPQQLFCGAEFCGTLLEVFGVSFEFWKLNFGKTDFSQHKNILMLDRNFVNSICS